ncbi:MAG TPA: hypothetical protein DEO40_02550 [Treponema sp.]|nr:hypothetical protein [Treponema sp.]HCA19541.1 hypothetical protein [Treponema sp.]
MKRKTLIQILIIISASILVIAAILFFSSRKKDDEVELRLPVVRVENPSRGTIQSSVTLSGHVEAKSMIPVVPLVSGTVLDFPVQVGQSVKEGDVVARLDSEPFDQQVMQAKASYLAYENAFKRVERLYKGGNATEQNYDQSKAARDAAKAQYDLALLQQGYATVRSKSSGTVITVMSAKGSTAAQGQPVAVVADLSALVVNLKVPEKYYTLIAQNKDSLSISVIHPDSGESFSAEPGPIDPYVSPQTKTFNVECRLSGNVSLLRPGMFVKTKIVYKTFSNVPVLNQSIRKTDGSVYVLKDGKAEHLEIIPLAEDEINFAVDESYADFQFIVDGQNSVFDGQEVKIQS